MAEFLMEIKKKIFLFCRYHSQSEDTHWGRFLEVAFKYIARNQIAMCCENFSSKESRKGQCHECSLSLWRVVRGSKLMHLELIHGLFIT